MRVWILAKDRGACVPEQDTWALLLLSTREYTGVPVMVEIAVVYNEPLTA